jgi:cysteine-rich repeat protein
MGGTFVCTRSDECPSGRCEAAGFCSFADEACGSGRRFSEFAGDGLADQCTQPGGLDGGDDSSTGAVAEGSTTIAPDLGPPSERDPSSIECGNGFVELDEPCDDGNEIDGDGCNHDCVISGTVLWTVIEDGPNSGEDHAHAVAMLPSGDVLVTGRYGANAGDLYVKGYAADSGTLLWSKLQGTAQTEEGRALAADDGTRFFVGGFVTATGDGENLFTRAYDVDPTTDPAVAWSKPFDSTTHGDDRVNGCALRPDHAELLTFGFLRAPDDTNTHVRAHDVETGTPAWSVTPDIDGSIAQLSDDARDGVVTEDGRVFVVGTIVPPGQGQRSDGWLAELVVGASPQNVHFRAPVRVGTAADVDVVAAIAAAPDGTLVVAGHRGQRAFYARYDRALALEEDHVPDAIALSEVLDVAVDGTGAVVTVGYTTSEAHGRDIEVAKYLADGTRLWRDREDGSAAADDVGRGVTIAPDDTVIAVGSLRQSVTGSDLWVRRYAP